ncbi:hypothetical protein WJX74_002388 [Apatococcus lobatus]|uniref:Uncharacterized protein n=1 Tax=Apatococcus lobatus TaxID=904363 RepID=A0AAW1S4U5_9CHLO
MDPYDPCPASPSGQPGFGGHIWTQESLNLPRYIAASIQKLGSPSVLAIIRSTVQKISNSGRFACCAVRVQSSADKSWSELQVLVPYCLIWEKSPSPAMLFEALFSAEGRKSGSLCCTADACIPDAKIASEASYRLRGAGFWALLLSQAQLATDPAKTTAVSIVMQDQSCSYRSACCRIGQHSALLLWEG